MICYSIACRTNFFIGDLYLSSFYQGPHENEISLGGRQKKPKSSHSKISRGNGFMF